MAHLRDFGPGGAFVLLVAAVSLAGCIATGHIQGRVENIDQSVGISRNQAILVNIVRASLSEPLYFLAISKVSGSGYSDLKSGLPTITIGPGQMASQQQFAFGANLLENQASSNFDVGVQETHDFYNGLLKPIDLVEANLLIHQGFSREMVFSVLVDKIRVRTGDRVTEIRNDPASSADFEQFQKYRDLALGYGLTIETYDEPNPNDIPAGAKGAGGSAPKFVRAGKLCFDQALAAEQNLAAVGASKIKCSDSDSPAAKTARKSSELTFTIDGKRQAIEIILRSPYQMFQYLGGMLASGKNTVLNGTDPGQIAGRPILVVTKGDGGPCFTKVAYSGADYCVPNEGSENTKRVFTLIDQILALNTTAEDLPVTDSVRIIQ
jgi:hypothetical protein